MCKFRGATASSPASAGAHVGEIYQSIYQGRSHNDKRAYAPTGSNMWQLPIPLEFENDDVICCFRANTLKFSIGRSTLALNTLKFSLKRRKNAKSSFAISARGTISISRQSTRFPPLEKFLRSSAPPLDFESCDAICCYHTKGKKFAHAFGARLLP